MSALLMISLGSVVLASIAAGLFYGVNRGFVSSARDSLRLFYRCVFGLVLALGIIVQIPRENLPRPQVQVFDSRGEDGSWWVTVRSSDVSHAIAPLIPVMKLPNPQFNFLPIFFALSLIGFGIWLRDRLRLRRRLRSLAVLRRFRGIFIAVGPASEGAYSCLDLGFRPWIVLPDTVLVNRAQCQMIIAHEWQHHRQGDLIWVTALEFVRRVLFWNPILSYIVPRLQRMVERLQEFSCDEVVLQKRHSPQDYGHCLIQCAEESLSLINGFGQQQQPQYGTTSLIWPFRRSMPFSQREFLRRRIKMLFKNEKVMSRSSRRMNWVRLFAVIAIVGGALASVSIQAMVEKSDPLTVSQVQRVIAERPRSGKIEIEVNELVVAQLNRYLATWEGRKYIQETRARMTGYEKMIRETMAQYKMPNELMAIPFFESGFRNDVFSPAPYRSLGLWQFVAETANRYGMKVNASIDERKIPEKETVAAMKYLGKLYRQFGDWRLAITAYNMGEIALENKMAKLDTKDPWKIERASKRLGYLSGVMAALILIEYPEITEIRGI